MTYHIYNIYILKNLTKSCKTMAIHIAVQNISPQRCDKISLKGWFWKKILKGDSHLHQCLLKPSDIYWVYFFVLIYSIQCECTHISWCMSLIINFLEERPVYSTCWLYFNQAASSTVVFDAGKLLLYVIITWDNWSL